MGKGGGILRAGVGEEDEGGVAERCEEVGE